jgi:patatin-like phospholipase/acyl hydrolase
MSTRVRRVLSIDGGGIKGTFPASFLASLEDTLGGSITSYFDLIVGTSTGGIIAIGLGLGLSAKEILRFYEEHGPSIFCGSRFTRTLRQVGVSKYNANDLRAALQSVFGDRKIGDSTKRLVVPSCNLDTGEVHIWKTSHHPRLERDYKALAVDAALATAAAPTYFPTHRSAAGSPLLDGGMWANNPVGIAVVEAVGVLGWSKDSLAVLSLGCTTAALDVQAGRYRALGWLYWGFGTKLIDVFMAAQSSAALGMAAHLIGDRANLVRISPTVSRSFALDNVREIPSLRGLGDSEARKALPTLRNRFFTETADAFIPDHAL